MNDYTLLCERKAAFETNSSSSHSLVINQKTSLWTKEEVAQHCAKDGNIYVYLTEWGKSEEQTKNDAIEFKLSYLYTYCYDLPENQSAQHLTMLTEAIEEYSGLKVIIENPNTIYKYCDSSEPDKLFNQGKQAILNFLFNPKSYFIIDEE